MCTGLNKSKNWKPIAFNNLKKRSSQNPSFEINGFINLRHLHFNQGNVTNKHRHFSFLLKN